jgi:anti-anti-sigma regulatory factor
MTCAFSIEQFQRVNNLMLRITENFYNSKTVIFRLDGTLTAASCAELAVLCSQYQDSEGKVVQLDMAGVVFMKEEVAKRLLGLRSDRLSIINCSPFIEMLLRMVAT